MRDDLLAGAAEVLDGRRELRERRLAAARHVVEVEHHRLDARVFLRGLERVDEIPEQGLALRFALRLGDGLVDRAAGQLLDDLALAARCTSAE